MARPGQAAQQAQQAFQQQVIAASYAQANGAQGIGAGDAGSVPGVFDSKAPGLDLMAGQWPAIFKSWDEVMRELSQDPRLLNMGIGKGLGSGFQSITKPVEMNSGAKVPPGVGGIVADATSGLLGRGGGGGNMIMMGG